MSKPLMSPGSDASSPESFSQDHAESDKSESEMDCKKDSTNAVKVSFNYLNLRDIQK